MVHQFSHFFQSRPCMGEKLLECRTEIVQPRFTVRGLQEPMLGAPAVTGKTEFTTEAVLRQILEFALSELLLLSRGNEILERCNGDVAAKVGWVDIMITGINVAVMLQCQTRSTGFFKPA